MGKYSIKELEQLSGIKAHTIRIWEKRHKLIQPERTPTNIRYYSDEDLKKIINVSVLNNHGVKISRIAHLNQEDLNKQVVELAETQNSADLYADQLIVSMIDMEEDQFDKIFSVLQLKFGFERAITEIVYPFLNRIGVLWQTGNINPAQEHFVSNLIRQKLIVAIDSLPAAPRTAHRVVLFLPENELHELSLLFQNYLVRKEGLKAYYLGQTVPYADLQKVIAQHQPQFLISSITSSPQSQALQAYVTQLSTDFPQIQIILSGAAMRKTEFELPANVHHLDKVPELRKKLRDLVPRL